MAIATSIRTQEVNNRREEYKNGNLSEERIEQLESLGFSWDPLEEAWQARFNELMQYKQQLGDCNVPTRESQLGNWVSTQRAFYKRGTLSPKRIEQLEAVGFEWVLGEGGAGPKDKLWRTRYIDLVHYLTEHGNCNVPRKGHSTLGNWVCTQRVSHKGGRLSQCRIDYLEIIGFGWELKRNGRWLPDRPKPNVKDITRLIKKERGTPVAQALKAYLN